MRNEQDMRKVFNALLADAPYPVFREDTKAFIKNNFDKFTKPMQKEVKSILNENPGGAAFCEITRENAKRVGKPKRFFLLEDRDEPDLHVYFMLHEFGHYVCSCKDCPCTYDDTPNHRVLAEYHAEKYAITQLLKMNWLPALTRAIYHIESGEIYYGKRTKNVYAHSARRLMRTKLWQKALIAHYRRPENADLVENGVVPYAYRGYKLGYGELVIGETKATAAA